MPNWCYNDLVITGKTETLRGFVNDITVAEPTEENPNGTRLKLSSLYPCPEELHEYQSPLRADKDGKPLSDEEREALATRFMAQYGATDWYDWCNTHWGTKWGDSDTEITSDLSDGNTELRIRYETAWSPASGLIAKISSLYPQLVFSVVSTEESDAFLCYQVFHNGKVVGEQNYDTENVPDEISKLADDDDNYDEYYEALNDWQCERNDKAYEGANTFVENYLKQLKAQRDKVEYQYKVKMLRLRDEMDNALKEFDVSEVITAK